MPHVNDDVLKKVLERGYATNAGEFAALIAHQCIMHLKYNGTGFNKRAEVEAGLSSTLEEWKKFTSKYEDKKALENGNIFEKLEKKL